MSIACARMVVAFDRCAGGAKARRGSSRPSGSGSRRSRRRGGQGGGEGCEQEYEQGGGEAPAADERPQLPGETRRCCGRCRWRCFGQRRREARSRRPRRRCGGPAAVPGRPGETQARAGVHGAEGCRAAAGEAGEGARGGCCGCGCPGTGGRRRCGHLRRRRGRRSSRGTPMSPPVLHSLAVFPPTRVPHE